MVVCVANSLHSCIMAKLKTWLLQRLWSAGENDPLSKVIEEQSEALQRYRETDRKRQQVHVRLKSRLKEVKNQASARKEEANEARKEISRLNSELTALREIIGSYERLLPRRGGEGSGETHEKLLAPGLDSRNERKAWRHWMRLGVLHQHPPRPFSTPGPRGKPVTPASPTLSIVTPSYQQAAFLEASLKSVIDQNYPKLEYIVMDGGSQDGSAEVIRRHAPHLAYWQSQKDGGHSAALIDGFSRSTGDIMAWLNSDDLYLPGTLAYVADYFRKHPEVDAVYGHRVLINEAGHEVGRWFLPPHDGTMLLWADYIPQETWFWRRRIYDQCGGLDPSMRFAMDWDLLLRMQQSGAVFHRLPEFLGAFRVHEAQKSQAIIHDVGAQDNALLRRRELGIHFHEADLRRRSTAFQLRALRTMRFWRLGIHSVRL